VDGYHLRAFKLSMLNLPTRSTQSSIPPGIGRMSTGFGWRVRKRTSRCTSPMSMVLRCMLVWLRASEAEIRTVQSTDVTWVRFLTAEFISLANASAPKPPLSCFSHLHHLLKSSLSTFSSRARWHSSGLGRWNNLLCNIIRCCLGDIIRC